MLRIFNEVHRNRLMDLDNLVIKRKRLEMRNRENCFEMGDILFRKLFRIYKLIARTLINRLRIGWRARHPDI